ncbi:tetratricopeptide repeat protein [Pendulispora albinea]|uniref:Tetratricopeptide repeat protein n=1 Tax=Pendulispora albinea TaxID=2741071 RepID=A0ABZ2M9W1_9BACT
MMVPLWRSRSQRIAAAVTLGLMLAVGFLPLFGGPGYEHALASGLIVPGVAAVATALELSRGRGLAPVVGVLRGAGSGLLLAGVAWVTALVHGLRVGFCDAYHGALGFLLTAVPGCLLGGIWGACVAEVARRGSGRRRVLLAIALGVGGPLASAGVSVWRFYSSPMVFAFDPFVGYFSGTLYDTVIDAGAPLLTYRLGTAASVAAVVLGASLLARAGAGAGGAAEASEGADLRAEAGETLVLAVPDATTVARAVVAVLALFASVLITVEGPSLGHWQTPSTIARELGGRKSGPRCDAVYPDDLREDEAALLVKDCEEEIAAVERFFGARGPERITAFFFRDAGEKKRLMGAGDTYIAKPWRHEVYLQMHAYPHPVLGHEIAHVVAGSFGRGPFRAAGALGGLWPNPGLIEGVAVAASPDEDELTDETWARAMLDLGILPSLKSIFSIDFLGQSASKSYTVAGAFIRWMVDHYGVAHVRAIYGGASTEQAVGKSWDALDLEFRAHLGSIPFPPEARSYAKAKFDRPAIFGRRCPHVVDALLHEADVCRESRREEKALALYADVLARDPESHAARYGRALVDLRDPGRSAEGRAALERIAEDAGTPRTFRDRAEEAIADWDFLAGAYEAASRRYERLAAQTVDEDMARTLEVKALAARDPAAQKPMASFLLGAPHRPSDPLLSGARLGAWSAQTHDPLADYILGKNISQHGWYEEGLPYLERALSADPDALRSVRVRRELLRSLAQSACALGDRARIAHLRDELTGPGTPFRNPSSGRLESVVNLLTRCSTP